MLPAKLAPLQPLALSPSGEKVLRRSGSLAKVDKESMREAATRPRSHGASRHRSRASADRPGAGVAAEQAARRPAEPQAQEEEAKSATTAPQAGDQRCAISTVHSGSSEIRTKVFRMGAPLLRSTIPVSLGSNRRAEEQQEQRQRRENADGEEGDSDAESVLSVSEGGADDQCALSVTLDFPC